MYDVNEPDDLELIEKAMAHGPRPPEELRDRVLKAVNKQLPIAPATISMWQYAGAVAAVIVLGGTFLLCLIPGKPTPGMDGLRPYDATSSQIQMGLTPDGLLKLKSGSTPPQGPSQNTPAPTTSQEYIQRMKDYRKLTGD